MTDEELQAIYARFGAAGAGKVRNSWGPVRYQEWLNHVIEDETLLLAEVAACRAYIKALESAVQRLSAQQTETGSSNDS